jgi:hypothetical protein
MGVGQRKHRQEGNRIFARSADTAPNRDPVMVFVMSLLLPAAMPNDRILRANRTPANDYFRASLRPIGLQLALSRGKCDKDNRANGALPQDSDIFHFEILYDRLVNAEAAFTGENEPYGRGVTALVAFNSASSLALGRFPEVY